MQHFATSFLRFATKSLMAVSVSVLALSATASAKTVAVPTKHLAAPSVMHSDVSPFLAEKTNQAALNFVERTGITKSLSLLILQDVKNRNEIRAAISHYGMDKVQATVVNAIQQTQHYYAPQWNQLMAGIYVEHFSARELASILARREASPYFSRLLDLQSTIADAVNARGTTLVTEARIDVMSRVADALPINFPASLGR